MLHKLEKPVDEDNLKKVVAATGAEVDEGKVKLLVASLKGVDIDAELEKAVAVAAAPAASEAEAAPAAEEEKEEKEDASAAAEGLSSLFG